MNGSRASLLPALAVTGLAAAQSASGRPFTTAPAARDGRAGVDGLS